jgi:hypothetical protein
MSRKQDITVIGNLVMDNGGNQTYYQLIDLQNPKLVEHGIQ